MEYCFIDKRAPSEAVECLTALGFLPILIEPPEALIGSAVASHTDLAVFCHNNTAIAGKKYLSENPLIKKALHSAFATVIESECEPGAEYPRDAAYNALAIGGYLFAKKDTVCPDILAYAERAGLKVIPVRQGYPACLTLRVGNAAITSDRGLYRAITEAGLRVLLIDNSERIKLPPYPYGFIGGAAGVSQNTVYFIGNLTSHERSDDIRAFIESEGYSAVSLMPGADSLFDLGGIAFSPIPELITAPTAGSKRSPKNPKSE